MASLDSLREEIRAVFQIFDENNSGFISLSECVRVIYIVTGERLLRNEVRRLIALMLREVSQDTYAVHDTSNVEIENCKIDKSEGLVKSHSGQSSLLLDEIASERQCASLHRGTSKSVSLTSDEPHSVKDGCEVLRKHEYMNENLDEVSIDIFERVLLHKLNARSFDKELIHVFTALEDPERPGYVTKKSLARACLNTQESLTECEIDEMFDPRVTKVPSDVIDFTTFSNIISAAKEQIDL